MTKQVKVSTTAYANEMLVPLLVENMDDKANMKPKAAKAILSKYFSQEPSLSRVKRILYAAKKAKLGCPKESIALL